MSDPIPRFNHVAMSVPSRTLQDAGQRALLAFYGEVFGWTEMPTLSRPGELLVLRAYSNEQFVYIHASDEPMRCGGREHVGLSVAQPEELEAMYERARKIQERDPEVELVERKVDDFEVLKLHSFYVRYRLPLMFEVQCFEWARGAGPQARAG